MPSHYYSNYLLRANVINKTAVLLTCFTFAANNLQRGNYPPIPRHATHRKNL